MFNSPFSHQQGFASRNLHRASGLQIEIDLAKETKGDVKGRKRLVIVFGKQPAVLNLQQWVFALIFQPFATTPHPYRNTVLNQKEYRLTSLLFPAPYEANLAAQLKVYLLAG